MLTPVRLLSSVLSLSAILALAGCEGTDALVNHGTLDVHTHMSETVFLDPVAPRLHTIYIGIRNTSDYPDIDVKGPLAAALTQRGYTIVDDPAEAHYLLQANVLQAGKIKKDEEAALLGGGFGQPLLAGAVAGSLAGAAGGNYGTSLGVGLGIAAGSALLNYAYQDVTYAITIDIQLSERPLSGVKVHQTTNLHHGTHNRSANYAVTERTAQTYGGSEATSENDNNRDQSVDEDVDFKKYNVRDIAYADKVNLKMEEAIPTLVQHLTSSFANLFE